MKRFFLTPTTVPTALDSSIVIVPGGGRRDTGRIVCPALEYKYIVIAGGDFIYSRRYLL